MEQVAEGENMKGNGSKDPPNTSNRASEENLSSFCKNLDIRGPFETE